MTSSQFIVRYKSSTIIISIPSTKFGHLRLTFALPKESFQITLRNKAAVITYLSFGSYAPATQFPKKEFTGDNSIRLDFLDLSRSSCTYCGSTFAFAFSIKGELDSWLKIPQITDRSIYYSLFLVVTNYNQNETHFYGCGVEWTERETSWTRIVFPRIDLLHSVPLLS